MTIDELIAALEKAEGPSRKLDEAIVVSLYPRAQFRTDEGYIDPIVFHAEPLVTQKAMLPRYTASIDAALTLVPDGMEWSLTTLYGEATAEVGLNNTTGMHSTGRRKDGNVAIALCIAALRARKP